MVKSTCVFVSGANGYIAQHICKSLLANKNTYKVVGSVRSKDKGEKLKLLLCSKNFSYEIVEAIENKEAFKAALKNHPEVCVFLHVASPVTFAVKDPEKEILTPAICGTRNLLNDIKKYGPQINRVVVTSAAAAMHSSKNTGDFIDESSWNNITYKQALSSPYLGSKPLAEKAAWNFVTNEMPNFALSTINPTFVFGPQAFNEGLKGRVNYSTKYLSSLLRLKPNDQLPSMSGSLVDVRDVATAHIAAFELEQTGNRRLLVLNGYFSSQTIMEIIHEKFPHIAAKLPVGKPGNGAKAIKKLDIINNVETKKILGFQHIENTIIDTVQKLIEAGKA